MHRSIAIIGLSALLGACSSWVQVTSAGRMVSVAMPAEVTNCTRIGSSSANALSRVAFIQRGSEKLQEELINLAKQISADDSAAERLGLTRDEKAFYDALAANESAVQAMGDDKLKVIAAELITKVRQSVTIDWTLRESARAKIKVMVKRILNKYGYPPDLQDEAVQTVLKQAELLCAEWV